jgi:hypothetical protein
MKKLTVLIVLIIVLVLAISRGFAQSDLKPKKFDNPQWKEMVYIDFQVGKDERAMTIIKEYFIKAAKKAGLQEPEMMLSMISGEWNLVLIWRMKGGVEDLNWEISPDNVAWMKALGEVAGGADKAKALLDEYLGLINRTAVQYARAH